MSATAATSRKPHDTPFKQQKLKAWQPILTPFSVIVVFLSIAVVFIPIGIGILVASNSVIDVGPIRYDEVSDSAPIDIHFTWPKTTTENVYLYYQLSNFYQNHRRYVKSRSDVQLSGSSLAAKRTMGDCTPWETWGDQRPPNLHAIPTPLPAELDSLPLNPCGLIANSIFNDTFLLFTGACSPCSGTGVTMTKQGIAWKTDREKKFKNLVGATIPSVAQHLDVEDEEFIVWMRTAGLPTFKKLNRIIHGGLTAGEYTLTIEQNFPVKLFNGEKAFYLSTTTWIGGKNDFLGWAYIAVGAFCVLLAIAFFIKHKMSPRTLGDPRFMKEWKS